MTRNYDYPINDDDPIDEYPYTPPQKAWTQVLKERAQKVAQILPYAFLAGSLKCKSQTGLLVSIFALIATKKFDRHVVITNCTFSDTGLVVQ